MIPQFKITADNADVTAAINARLVSLRISDESGFEADELSITVHDAAPHIEPPRKGVVLRVWLGYVGAPLVEMGAYTVDEVELEGPPQRMTIRARGIDWASVLKALEDKDREDITVEELVQSIAATTGRIARVSKKVAETRIKHLVQRGESAVHLMTRLGQQYGFTLTAKNDEILAIETAPQTTVSGKPIPVKDLARHNLTTWRVREAERDGAFGSVVARYYEYDVGLEDNAIAGEGEPVRVLKGSFASRGEAAAAADAELARVGRRGGALAIVLPGDPQLKAETRINLSDLGKLGDGLWVIERAEHELSDQGYSVRIDGARVE